jgi:hypothetical protein
VSRYEDIALQMIEAFNRLSVEQAIRVCDPDVELTTLLDRLGEAPVRGHDGLRVWFARMRSLWAFVEVRNWTIEEHGDALLVVGDSRIRGRGSRGELELDWVAAGEVRDRLFVSFGLYLDRAEGVAAIGGSGDDL